MEQTDITQLWLKRDMLLHWVKILSSEKSGLESDLRAFERVIQWLITHQVHATPARHTSEPTPGSSRLLHSSVPTPGPSGSRGFSVKSSNLRMYEGKCTLDCLTPMLWASEWHFKNAARAFGWVSTTCCGGRAVLQQKCDAAVWAMHRVPVSTLIQWSTFCVELKDKDIQSDPLDLVKCQWEELSLKKGERITGFNKHFCRLLSKLDPHQPIPTKMLPDTYGYKIEKGNQGVYKDLVCNIGMRNRTRTLEQRLEHLAALDTSLNKSQPGSGSGANTTTNVSAMKMDSMPGGTTGTVGTAKNDSLTCYNCGQVGHISCKCPNCDLMENQP